MKNFASILFCLSLLNLMLPGAYAGGRYPVCFWNVVDQERYIYPQDLEQMDWKMIRKLKHRNRMANSEKKYLTLTLLDKRTPDGGTPLDASFFSDGVVSDSSVAVVRDPNGELQLLPWEPGETGKIKLPADNDLIGRYLVGIHLVLADRDVDGDGSFESIHFCAKHLVSHRKNGGRVGSASVVFLDDAQHMPLEIGPVVNTAKSRFNGGRQVSHRSYEMMVKYNKEPLPGARVSVIALGSQWERSFVTDERGQFEVMPPDDRLVPGEWQNYLYVATHHDLSQNAFYTTTFPVVVYKNRPEWRSKAMGFIYWSIVGGGLCLMMVAGFAGRRYWRNTRKMIIFEHHRIKKD